MGLFNKLFGKQESNSNPVNEPNTTAQLTPCKTEQELLERYGGIALEKQLHLGEIIGDNNWNVDMTAGEISFGEGLVYPMQVLGTFSHSSETWLWAWANTKSGMPAAIMQQALQLKAYGVENGIELLSIDSFDFAKHDLHVIGIIASGMFNASGYYIADYGQGTMVVTIKSDHIDNKKKDNHISILTVFPQLISQFEMNHKNALLNYFRAKGYAVVIDGNKLIGSKNDQHITGQFDEQYRLISLNG